jgi:hypothetical protein
VKVIDRLAHTPFFRAAEQFEDQRPALVERHAAKIELRPRSWRAIDFSMKRLGGSAHY